MEFDDAPGPEAAGRRRGLAVAAGLTSFSAAAGAVGLATGVLALDHHRLDGRLPFASPVLGGLALAAVVAAPFAVLASCAWRGATRTDEVAVAAGVVLVGWIGVQLLFLRQLSFFHPAFAVVGLAFAGAGARHRGRRSSGLRTRPGGVRR